MTDKKGKSGAPETEAGGGHGLPASDPAAGSADWPTLRLGDLADSPSVGEVLKILRTGSGMTQQEMADRLEVSLRTYSRLEGGEVPKQPAARARIARKIYALTPERDWEKLSRLASLRPDQRVDVVMVDPPFMRSSRGSEAKREAAPRPPSLSEDDHQLLADLVAMIINKSMEVVPTTNTAAISRAAVAAYHLVRRAGGDQEARREVEEMIRGLIEGLAPGKPRPPAGEREP
jgi:transcriptional regulator with XRE-family HTH domain